MALIIRYEVEVYSANVESVPELNCHIQTKLDGSHVPNVGRGGWIRRYLSLDVCACVSKT